MDITPYYSAINLSCRLTSITGLRRNKCSVRTDEASFARLSAHCYSVACVPVRIVPSAYSKTCIHPSLRFIIFSV